MTEEVTNTLGTTNTAGEAGNTDAAATAGVNPDQGTTTNTDGQSDGVTGPVEYGEFKVPDGVEFDEGFVSSFKQLAKKYELSQDEAQDFIDMQAKEHQRQSEGQSEAWTDLNNYWAEQAAADKEIGGSKEAFEKNVGLAIKALETYGTPELREALTVTGAGNHPEMIRFCSRIGKAISEDGIVAGRTGGQEKPTDLAHRLFPNMN